MVKPSAMSSKGAVTRHKEQAAASPAASVKGGLGLGKGKGKGKGGSPAKRVGLGRGKGVVKKSRRSGSLKAGIFFPVGRIKRLLRQGRYAKRLSGAAPVFLAAVLEYLAAELLDTAGNMAHQHNKKRIKPRHISLAIKDDSELEKLLRNVTIAEGGMKPGIAPELLKKPGNHKTSGKDKKGKAQGQQEEDEYAGVPGGLGLGLLQEQGDEDSSDGEVEMGGGVDDDESESSSDDSSASSEKGEGQ